MTPRSSLRTNAPDELMRAIADEFTPQFAPGAATIYVEAAASNRTQMSAPRLSRLGVRVKSSAKLPSVVLHDAKKDRLFVIELAVSHGPINANRHSELEQMFSGAVTSIIVYVTVCPTQGDLSTVLKDIAWGTVVWVAESPSHLIHFDGDQLAGPYPLRN